MRRVAVVMATALIAASLVGSAAAALKLAKRAGGFASPVYATVAPGERGLFVVEQAGRIVRVHEGRRNTFLNIEGRVVSGGEQGLLSVAFHPRYDENHRFFVYFTNNDGNLRVVGFRANDAGTRAVKSTARTWIAVSHPNHANHNGGQLQFGRDGLLYAATGDGGSGGDRARALGSRLGKLLSVNVDNPGAKPKIVAVGFRNPWRFSVDRATGRFFVADVGQSVWEEIDVFAPGRDGLENYGWNRFEGDHRHSSNPFGPGRYVRPIHEYRHRSGRCSVTGGFMVRGAGPGAGRYFYGDYCTGEVWSFRYADGKKTGVRREPFTVPGRLSSFGMTSGGRLLLLSHSGTIYRLARD
jgi:hypothetical protein